MKKALLSFLLIAYIASVSGATIERHFCMGRYVGYTFFSAPKNKACGQCGMEEKKGGCCHDEQQYLKLSTDHQSVSTVAIPDFFEAIIACSFSIVQEKARMRTKGFFPLAKGPPLRYDAKQYLLNRIFLI